MEVMYTYIFTDAIGGRVNISSSILKLFADAGREDGNIIIVITRYFNDILFQSIENISSVSDKIVYGFM